MISSYGHIRWKIFISVNIYDHFHSLYVSYTGDVIILRGYGAKFYKTYSWEIV